MMRKTFLIVLLFVQWSQSAYGQYFQFSQYNYTPQRINPASVATSDFASLSFLHRNQTTAADFNLASSMASASYPLLNNRNGMRWGGIGLTLLDDRSGVAGIFNTQEAALSIATNVYLNKFQTLSLGAKGLYQAQKIDPAGLFTGMQYIPDRGFDGSLFSGENFDQLRLNFFTISLGLHWQQVDRDNNRVAYWSISFFDFNKPQASFLNSETQLKSTAVAAVGVRIYKAGPLSVMPEILYTRSYQNNLLNIGAITSYELSSSPSLSGRVDLITKYVPGRSGIIGTQFHKENFSVGFSYDFPVFKKNIGNLGAIEIGIELRGLVKPQLKGRANAKRKSKTPQRKQPVTVSQQRVQETATKKETNNPDSVTAIQPKQTPALKENLQHKQDSVLALAEAGKIKHEALVIERVTLHFNFEFNSANLDGESAAYIDELAEALLDNPHLSIKLVGHTDNIGSARFNERLSLQRANAVKARLVEQGVDSSRIITEGKGLLEPLTDNDTEEGRAKNRRVELTILYN
ncbi:MAG: PorP/SprF family type IX secretion system membrane protein [Cyclobacteriaceae bacterium]|nr:PorP/SprF family type IX secretion system membrane protein [Cyclobacteriaceae bacterium]